MELKPVKGGKRKSCECSKRRSRHKPVKDISGQRFGDLVAIEFVGRNANRTTWKMLCDCGTYCHKTINQLCDGHALNCGDRLKHVFSGWYPIAPTPYPPEAGAIVAKYMHLAIAKPQYKFVDQAVEDYRMERLLRCAWIVVYRRSQGEEFSELKERRYIAKSMRFAPYTVHRVRQDGGLSYTQSNSLIGGVMTDLTLQNGAVAQAKTQREDFLSIPKRLPKFRRC